VTELRLEVGELVFEDLNAHQDNVFWLKSSCRFNVEEEFVWLGFPIVIGFIYQETLN
jgi:hypothetical protein